MNVYLKSKNCNSLRVHYGMEQLLAGPILFDNSISKRPSVHTLLPACFWGGVGFKSKKHHVILKTLKIVPSSTMHLIVRVRGIPWPLNRLI